MFDWFWESGDVPEGNEPISDLIKDELWTNPMRGSTEETQVDNSALERHSLTGASCPSVFHSNVKPRCCSLSILTSTSCLSTMQTWTFTSSSWQH